MPDDLRFVRTAEHLECFPVAFREDPVLRERDRIVCRIEDETVPGFALPDLLFVPDNLRVILRQDLFVCRELGVCCLYLLLVVLQLIECRLQLPFRQFLCGIIDEGLEIALAAGESHGCDILDDGYLPAVSGKQDLLRIIDTMAEIGDRAPPGFGRTYIPVADPARDLVPREPDHLCCCRVDIDDGMVPCVDDHDTGPD